VKMYLGIGYLAELVDLYNHRRDDLFSKNVRYFLKSRKNTERGPSREIRKSLRDICFSSTEVSFPPEMFAFYHNGITLFARDVRVWSEDGATEVREPYILNGCQTIKTGFFFFSEQKLRGKMIDDERWKRIRVPLRIITTRDEKLIRLITIANNRQNQMSPSALRANDPEQVELADRLKQHGIFYQRQEGAFAELEETDPGRITTDYPRTNQRYVDIEELARCLAATAGEFGLTRSPSHIFESEQPYQRCFGVRMLRSTVLVTFLKNLHDVLSRVLKKDLDLEPQAGGPGRSSLMPYAMCLLMRWLAKNRNHEFVVKYGDAMYGRDHRFREEVTKWLDNYHSRIKRVLQEKFMCLEDRSAASLKTAFELAEKSLSLKGIDPFAVFQDL
jgi:AIPR protein